jgi:hypothetical protein
MCQAVPYSSPGDATTRIGRARRALPDRQIDTGERSGVDVPTEHSGEIESGIGGLRVFQRERERLPRCERLQEGEGAGIDPLDPDGVAVATDEQPIGALVPARISRNSIGPPQPRVVEVNDRKWLDDREVR